MVLFHNYSLCICFGVDAARSITPVAALITSPAGAENVPPVAPVVVSVVVPVAQNVPPLTVAVGANLSLHYWLLFHCMALFHSYSL
jgi:hypothetical protein